jgi:hypothetical protein
MPAKPAVITFEQRLRHGNAAEEGDGAGGIDRIVINLHSASFCRRSSRLIVAAALLELFASSARFKRVAIRKEADLRGKNKKYPDL